MAAQAHAACPALGGVGCPASGQGAGSPQHPGSFGRGTLRCPPRSLGIQGRQRSASKSVYFQVTFLRKTASPKCLTLRLECREANSCPLPGPCTALIGGRSWRGLLGDTGCTWSERGTRLWARFPVSLCPQQDADTPSPAPAGTAYLGWGRLTGAWSSGTLAPSSTRHTPGQPRASAPAGPPACPPRPTAGPNPVVLRGAPSSRKPSRGVQQGLPHPQPGLCASCPRALRQRLGQWIPLERIMEAAGLVTPALCQPVALQDGPQP